jgi:hypothetical protein
MLWARMARASQAEVAREWAWPPNLCYRIADSALETSLSTGCPVEQCLDIRKGKQLREELTGACSQYAIGDHKVPHSGWMVGQPEVIPFHPSRGRRVKKHFIDHQPRRTCWYARERPIKRFRLFVCGWLRFAGRLQEPDRAPGPHQGEVDSYCRLEGRGTWPVAGPPS